MLCRQRSVGRRQRGGHSDTPTENILIDKPAQPRRYCRDVEPRHTSTPARARMRAWLPAAVLHAACIAAAVAGTTPALTIVAPKNCESVANGSVVIHLATASSRRGTDKSALVSIEIDAHVWDFDIPPTPIGRSRSSGGLQSVPLRREWSDDDDDQQGQDTSPVVWSVREARVLRFPITRYACFNSLMRPWGK